MTGPIAAARRPPWIARLIARAAIPGSLQEFMLGDLDEHFAILAQRAGVRRARRYYWVQSILLIRSAVALRRSPTSSTPRVTPARRLDMTTLWRDIHLAFRSILRTPGYAIVTAVTLALAIGANTLLFSIANPLVLRELPIRNPKQLGWIYLSNAEREIERGQASVPELLEWRRALTSFSELAGTEFSGGTLSGHGDARSVEVMRVTSNLPDVWGLSRIHGRLFLPGEDQPGQPLVGVLSHRFWRETFAGDPAVIGRVYAFDGQPITIVGVMEPAIEIGSLSLTDLWIPLHVSATSARDARRVSVTGRLAPGHTVETADAELQTVFAAQTREHARLNAGWRASVLTTHDALAGYQTWLILGLLGIVVAFVLLIACANLANLVMARLASRRRELEVRLALGASRWQILQPLLVESVLLALAGGSAGVGLAYGGLQLVRSAAYDPFMRQLAIDGNVLAFAALLALLTPLIFTLYPAISTRRHVSLALLHGIRTSGTRGATRKRNFLIGGQVALALSLMVLSALVTQSLTYLRRIDPGFSTRPLLTYRFELPVARYPDDASRVQFVRTLEGRLGAIPGVTGAAVMSHMPVLERDQARSLSGTPHDGMSDLDRPWASCFIVTSGFFQAMAIEVLAGRPLDPRDGEDAEPVAVLNRLAADRYFDTFGNALGRRVVIHDAAGGDRPVTIVGVVADTRDAQLTRSSPQIYVPFTQWPRSTVRAVVRSEDPAGRAADVQAVIRMLDPDVAVAYLKPLTTLIDEDLAGTTIINGLFVSYAVLALLLAAGGLFGVISYSVAQRRGEIGIRLALGASPRTIARMIVREGLMVTGAGAIVGLLMALFLARLSTTLLYGINAHDPPTFAAVVAVILTVALLATWTPAMRAMRVDPAKTLRAD